MQDKMLIIDGLSLAHRAFHALKEQDFQTADGVPTGALYGVAMMVLRLLEEENPDYFMVAFDLGRTFRHESYDDYKATRLPMDAQFKEQLPLIKEFFHLLGAHVIGVEGYEADDVIGAMTTLAQSQGLQVDIYSGDKDLFQLLGPGVRIFYPKRGVTEKQIVTAETMKENYGLAPGQWADYKALRGDPSDNIPGVKGIGDKTATRLLQRFHSVEQLLNRLDEVEKDRTRAQLSAHAQLIREYKKLTTILRDIPLPISLDDCRWTRPDHQQLADFFRKMEFKTLLARLEKKEATNGPVVETRKFAVTDYTLLSDEDLPAFFEGADEQVIAFQFLAEECNWAQGKAWGVAFSTGTGKNGFLPLTSTRLPESLSRWLIDPEAKKICYDAKTQMTLLSHYGVELGGLVFDLLLAAYLRNGGEKTLDFAGLVRDVLGIEEIPQVKDRRGKPVDLLGVKNDLFPEEGVISGVTRAVLTNKLHVPLREELVRTGMDKLFFDIELPLVKILFAMERKGIRVSPPRLRELRDSFVRKIRHLESEIYELAGEEFNISSPKQLGVVLFERLKLPVLKKTKTGYSTDASVLEELSGRHPLIRKVLDYRTLTKLNSTYVEALLGLIRPETGRVHTTFQQAVTATGRLSSTDPNLQNIPVHSEEGLEIRRCFIPDSEDRVFVSADYSQIELRVMAHLSGDEKLRTAFLQDEDIHQRTAAEIFNVPINEVTPELRGHAKAVNFGIIYGISGFGLAKGTGVPRKAAEEFIAAYFARYSGVQKYLEELINRARETGFVTTMLNRHRYLRDLRSRNFQKRSYAERMARNTPIQGSAADLIKLAMVRVADRLRREKAPADLLLQVHDDLLVETDRATTKEVALMLKEEMEAAFSLSVPLRVDLKAGDNWGDLEKI